MAFCVNRQKFVCVYHHDPKHRSCVSRYEDPKNPLVMEHVRFKDMSHEKPSEVGRTGAWLLNTDLLQKNKSRVCDHCTRLRVVSNVLR